MKRPEDRRSCHQLSFVLSLAVVAKDRNTAVMAYDALLAFVRPIPNQPQN